MNREIPNAFRQVGCLIIGLTLLVVTIGIFILKTVGATLEWIYTILQPKEREFDPETATIREWMKHEDISYRQARKKWESEGAGRLEIIVPSSFQMKPIGS